MRLPARYGALWIALISLISGACDEGRTPSEEPTVTTPHILPSEVAITLSSETPRVPPVLATMGLALGMKDAELRVVLGLRDDEKLPLRGGVPVLTPQGPPREGVVRPQGDERLWASEARFERLPYEPGVRAVGLRLGGHFSTLRAHIEAAWGEGRASTRRGRDVLVWHAPGERLRAWLTQDRQGDSLLFFEHYLPFAELLGTRPGHLGFETLPLIGATPQALAEAYSSHQLGIHEVSQDLGVPTSMRLPPTEYMWDAAVVALTVEEGVVVGVSVRVGVGVGVREREAIRASLRSLYGVGAPLDAHRVRYGAQPEVVLQESPKGEGITLHLGRIGEDAPGADGDGHRHFSAEVVEACNAIVTRSWANAQPAARLLESGGREVSETLYRGAAERFVTLCQVWPESRRACLARSVTPMRDFDVCQVNAGADVLGRVKPLEVRDALRAAELPPIEKHTSGEMLARIEGDWESTWPEASISRIWSIAPKGAVTERRTRAGGATKERRFTLGFPRMGMARLTSGSSAQEQAFVLGDGVFWSAALGEGGVYRFGGEGPLVVDVGGALCVFAEGRCECIVDNGVIEPAECGFEAGDEARWWVVRRSVSNNTGRSDGRWRFLQTETMLLDERLVESGTFRPVTRK